VGYPPRWMSQVHGTEVAQLDEMASDALMTADAAVARRIGSVCAVMVADCLPVIFTDCSGIVVAAAHAGWRGLAKGVLESTIASMKVPPKNIIAYMGQAIGPTQFEVGDDVRDAFMTHAADAETAFRPVLTGNSRKYVADIFALATSRMIAAGIPERQIYGGGLCTVNNPERFFSYRREGKSGQKSGRMAALIWMT
ncbi:MAG: peptidoglycan editing factor PgeF, partial [Pseudomonadota bacterium]